MKTFVRFFGKFTLMGVILGLILTACAQNTIDSTQKEAINQDRGNSAITDNQPLPDLGGWSYERQLVIDTYIARNNQVSTWTYMFLQMGKLIEICPSVGFPVPYSTQLTSPEKVYTPYSYQYGTLTIPNPEPNSLFPPAMADATWVSCVNPDGSISPEYFENQVFALPKRIKSDYQLENADDKAPSFTVNTTRTAPQPTAVPSK